MTQPVNNAMTAKVWLQLLALGALWGASFLFGRIAVAEIPPLTLTFLRVAIAAAALHIYLMAIIGQRFITGLAMALPFFMLGLFNNVVPFSLIFAGQTEIGAGLASIINATTPFWTALLASQLTSDEKLSPKKLAGILIGILGTSVLVGPSLVGNLTGPIWPKMAILGAALSYAFAAIYAKRFKGINPVLISTWQLTASSLILLPIILLFDGPTAAMTSGTYVWVAVISLALFSTAYAYFLYFSIITEAGATNASLVTMIVPAFAILLGVVFLSESMSVFEIAGVVLIGFGLLVFDGRIFART